LCVSCHDGADSKAEPDLRGELTTLFSRSYENLLQGEWVRTIREWNGMTYSMQNAEAVPPYTLGSHNSRLIELLEAGHYDVQLSREEWIKLVTWIDCGAPYYGSYYGRRNLLYRGQPDFRPEPTLESACGVPPEFPELPACEPLPAELLAWWPLDDGADGTTIDASGNGHNGQIVRADSVSEGSLRQALTLRGRGYLAAGGLGKHEAISVSLWVNPSQLPNRWNPLLFTDGASHGAFHFSLLTDGTPNVAIKTSAPQWAHRHATTPLAKNQWQHVVVTCDPRFGGEIRFFIDGQEDSGQALGLGLPLDLESFRIGAYRNWENSPNAAFHGALDDVRVFRGTLTDRQVAELHAAGRSGKTTR
jgi:hypothetical protein